MKLVNEKMLNIFYKHNDIHTQIEICDQFRTLQMAVNEKFC